MAGMGAFAVLSRQSVAYTFRPSLRKLGLVKLPKGGTVVGNRKAMVLAAALLLSLAALPPASASPPVADPGSDRHTICAVRKLAYERAMGAQPHRGELMELFDALELHSLCGMPTPPPSAPAAASDGSASNSASPSGARALHVDPTAGDDATGSPFRTIGAAVREARRKQIKSLVLEDGIHFLNETLHLTAADSGFSVSAARGANAWLSGGVALTNLAWKQGPGGVWAATVSDPAIEDIPGLLTVGAGTHAPASRFVRARYPNGNWETDMWGLCSTNEVRFLNAVLN